MKGSSDFEYLQNILNRGNLSASQHFS